MTDPLTPTDGDTDETPEADALVAADVLLEDLKQDLRRHLDRAHEALLWKLDGLGDHDVRRPMTPTGTNLLGVVKHVASVESEYLGSVFGRPFPEALPWLAEGMPDDADMWATADETRDDIVGLFRRVWAHALDTIDDLDLDATGEVPWWPPQRRRVSLGHIVVHLVAELNRHAGQLDIVRETIDGAAGLQQGNDNLPGRDADAWAAYRARVQDAADRFR
ncbi:DinB family protein [Jatrophihabitans fulvus]